MGRHLAGCTRGWPLGKLNISQLARIDCWKTGPPSAQAAPTVARPLLIDLLPRGHGEITEWTGALGNLFGRRFCQDLRLVRAGDPLALPYFPADL